MSKVKCNWCNNIIDEQCIAVVDDIEYCPICQKTGYLMDIEEKPAMLKLSEYNEIIRKEIEEQDREKEFCGVACDDCGTELKYVDYDLVLLSYPAQKSVICPNCKKRDFIIVKKGE